MKHKSHLLLGEHLLKLNAGFCKTRARRAAFLAGNLMPDYNLFTYLRGLGKYGFLVGHNQIYSERRCSRMAVRLKREGLRSVFSCYSFGTLMHYLADSYTYPHTVSFRETLRVHNSYERELRAVFPDCVRLAGAWRMPYPPDDPASFLRVARERYEQSQRSPRTDGIYVLWVCSMVYLSILKENKTKGSQNQIKQTDISKNKEI